MAKRKITLFYAPAHVLNLKLNKKLSTWKRKFGSDGNLWDFPLEELLDGTIEPNEYIWYWLIDGRCYETTEQA
jgi:hypothetical protein